MPCSPGVRPWRFNLIFTPLPAGDSVAVPASCPWPFCSLTVTGAGFESFAKAAEASASKAPMAAMRITLEICVLSINSPLIDFLGLLVHQENCTRLRDLVLGNL